MTYKKWFLTVIGLTFLGIAALAYFNIAIDPYNQYKDSDQYLLNQRAVLPGVTKNTDFDAFVIGTSMTENTDLKLIDKLYNTNSLRLSMSSASFKEQNQIANLALEQKDEDVKHVFWGIDFFKFNIRDMNYNESLIPDYLIDDNYYNDYKYLISISTVKNSMKVLHNNLNLKIGPKVQLYDRYEYSNWGKSYDFSSELVINDYNRLLSVMNTSTVFETDANETVTKFIKPVIIDNPKTQFHLFITPTTLAYYKYLQEVNPNIIHMIANIRKSLVEELNGLDNVTISDFSIKSEWTTDLDKYKDVSHYVPEINDLMIEQIEDPQNSLNIDNVSNVNEIFSTQVLSYEIPIK